MDPELFQLALKLARTLEARGWMLATAESCTGGWIAKVVTDVSGSSAWFDRGFVSYSNAAKHDLLDVPATYLDNEGAVSEAVARDMAIGALTNSAAQITVAVTGIAGPEGGNQDKPVGTVWLAWATADGIDAERKQFDGDREAVRRQTLITALEGVIERAGRTDSPG